MSGSKVHAQLYSRFLLSFRVTHLLSEGLRIELPWLPILEMGKFHALTLTVDKWPFGIIVTRHFRSKPGHSTARVYSKQIDRTLKVRLKEWLPRLLRPAILEYESF